MDNAIEMVPKTEKESLLETVSAYAGMLDELQLKIDALQFGLGVLQKTIKELR